MFYPLILVEIRYPGSCARLPTLVFVFFMSNIVGNFAEKIGVGTQSKIKWQLLTFPQSSWMRPFSSEDSEVLNVKVVAMIVVMMSLTTNHARKIVTLERELFLE